MAQGWKKIFNRINWLNRPNTTTPLNATNLNAGDSAIDELDDRILTLDTVKADVSVVNGMVADVSLNSKTGVITVTYKNGSHIDYDTNLEKIAVNFSYDYENQRLVLMLPDGSTQYVDMSALITQYEFKDSSTIAFSVDKEGKISASVKNGSITDSMLESGYLAKLTSQVAKAENASNSALTSSNSAYDNAKLSQSYAIGGSGVRDGEDSDNAKYYSEQASTSASSASESASSAESAKKSASESATSASNSATSASTSATNAKASETASATSATNAKKSETNAASSADIASENATSATLSANSASASAADAKSSANSASTSEKNASTSASSASTSAKNASTSEINAKKSETNAASSASSASTSASSASASATSASNSKDSASASATSASASATTASSKASAASASASNASSSEANAKKYYEQAKAISGSFSGALRPMGTVAFANLPSASSASAGDMYNISDEFVTTSDFTEGAGHTEPAGSNVYKTETGKWDVLAGSPVTGVKGANETSFRRGNVNITCENVGALATNGDSKSCTTTFTSNDSATGDSTPPTLLTDGETHASIFSKMSTIFKNVRWLLSKMGTTDISTLGDGTVTGALSTLNSNKEKINAFKNYCPTFATTYGNTAIKDALSVNLNSADGSENRIGYVLNGYTKSIPTDCYAGAREVYYFNQVEVWLKITGIDTNGVLAHWFNRYNGSAWSGWCRQSNISIVHESKTITLSNGNAIIDCGKQNAGSYIINATAYYSAVGYVTATVAIQSNRYIRIYQPEQNETLRKASYVCDYYILTVI